MYSEEVKKSINAFRCRFYKEVACDRLVCCGCCEISPDGE